MSVAAGGRMRTFLVVLLYLLAIGFAAVGSRVAVRAATETHGTR
jgi:hypothetical protein